MNTGQRLVQAPLTFSQKWYCIQRDGSVPHRYYFSPLHFRPQRMGVNDLFSFRTANIVHSLFFVIKLI